MTTVFTFFGILVVLSNYYMYCAQMNLAGGGVIIVCGATMRKGGVRIDTELRVRCIHYYLSIVVM